MKIKAMYLKPDCKAKYPTEATPISVIRAFLPDGRPGYEIDFDAGFYYCRKGGLSFRVPVGNVSFDEPLEDTKSAKAKAS